mgnify:CR=1 FL=1
MADKKNFKSFAAITDSISEVISLKATNETALDKVIQKRVDAEVERRATLLEKGFDKYNTAQKALAQCGPDLVTHVVTTATKGDEGEALVQKAYSDKRMKELQQLRKTVSELDVAFIKAYSEGNYEPLMKLVGGSGKPEGGKPENGKPDKTESVE